MSNIEDSYIVAAISQNVENNEHNQEMLLSQFIHIIITGTTGSP